MNHAKYLVTLSFLAACGGATKQPAMSPPGDMKMDMKMGMAPPSAASAAILASVKDYASWPTFAEMPTPTKSEGHMNMFVLAHHNGPVAGAIASHTVPLPDGSIIVKQQMPAADAATASLAIMAKQGGTWYWLEATPDLASVVTMNGMPLEGTKVSMCLDCHDHASDNDFVLTHAFK